MKTYLTLFIFFGYLSGCALPTEAPDPSKHTPNRQPDKFKDSEPSSNTSARPDPVADSTNSAHKPAPKEAHSQKPDPKEPHSQKPDPKEPHPNEDNRDKTSKGPAKESPNGEHTGPKEPKPRANNSQPETNLLYKEITAKYKEIDDRLRKLPLYIAVRTDYSLQSDFSMKSDTPLESALEKHDYDMVREITDNVISVLGKRLGRSGSALSLSIKTNQTDMFNLLLPRFKKLFLYQQNQQNPLEMALDLCDTSIKDCTSYLNEMLLNKFNPTPIKSSIKLDKEELKPVKTLINSILNFNSDPDGSSALRNLISGGCELNKISDFLENPLSQVDWISEKSKNKLSTLCYLMNNATVCRKKNTEYEVIKLLLEHNSNPNCSASYPIFYALFDPFILNNSFTFSSYFNLLLDAGANPFIPKKDDLFGLRMLGERVKNINAKYPHLLDELQLRSDLATIMGQKFNTIVYGSPYELSGGNTQKEVFDILRTSFADFQNEFLPDSLNEVKVLKDVGIANKLKRSIELAMDFLTSPSADKIIDQIFDNSEFFPVIIPAGWSGHAVSMIIYKDLLVKLNKGDRSADVDAGTRFYKFDRTKPNIGLLKPLFTYARPSTEPVLTSNAGKLLFDKTLKEFIYLGKKEEENQCVGNCTWESSASPSLQVALALLITTDPKDLLKNDDYAKAKRIIDHFKRFTSYKLVKKYIDHAMNTLGQNKCLPDTLILTDILKTEIEKATFFSKDDYFQQKIIDTILKSGLPLKNFHKKFPLELQKQVRYLLKKVGLSADNLTEEVVDQLYDIYDPRPERRDKKSVYPWGECFY